MSRFKCICAYDGTDFRGWQSQVGGKTIQDFLEARLSEIFKSKIRIHASGRTDAGVHALHQVFHFDAHWKHSLQNLLRALSVGYPKSIQVLKVSRVADDFHARFDVKAKRYIYKVCNGRALPNETRYMWSLGEGRVFDLEVMKMAAKSLLGTHDFTALSANRGNDYLDNPVKTLYNIDIVKRGKTIKFSVEGSGFLYKMVRMIVGVLVEVGLNKLSVDEVAKILESKKRGHKFQTAPALGLSLDKVFYE